MAILVTNIKTGFQQSEEEILKQALRTAKLSAKNVAEIHLYKKSLDARNQNNPRFISSVLIRLESDEEAFCTHAQNPNLHYKPEAIPILTPGMREKKGDIVIVGFGPAGIFAAYLLASMGYHPIVLERGYDVDQRVDAVNQFWNERTLNPACNVQYGEGGAGTFSDGKLTTRISDPRCEQVLQLLHRFGAPDEILTKAKPHIGTDKLRGVIKTMRKEIEHLGGRVLFGQTVEQIKIQNGAVQSVSANGVTYPTGQVVLAIGHSARDTFAQLLEQGVLLESKGFSVGVRIEHLQEQIDRGLYGKLAGHPALPQGEYQLSHRENGRGVYTFCMCPGGTVVPSSSSEGTVVTNGMSEFSRDRKNANAALVVSVQPEDFGSKPLDGVAFQLGLERRAFALGGNDYSAPAMTAGKFLNRTHGLSLHSVQPSYALGVTPCDFSELFPSFVTDMLEKGLRKFNSLLPGFAAKDAVMTGVETRTSSPVRIVRNERFQAVGVQGLYPCGEGAGYAGGIMSAAVDGLKIAEELIRTYRPD